MTAEDIPLIGAILAASPQAAQWDLGEFMEARVAWGWRYGSWREEDSEVAGMAAARTVSDEAEILNLCYSPELPPTRFYLPAVAWWMWRPKLREMKARRRVFGSVVGNRTSRPGHFMPACFSRRQEGGGVITATQLKMRWYCRATFYDWRHKFLVLKILVAADCLC